MKSSRKLIGPFSQILTLRNLPMKGALKDEQLEIISKGGILVNNELVEGVGDFLNLKSNLHSSTEIELVESETVALPGFVDCHTHICYAGSRATDFAARNNGKTYLEIAKEGGGIWSTVKDTRAASPNELVNLMTQRMDKLSANGVTTVEIKSGYGLGVNEELALLRAIRTASENHKIDVVPTCLAAHIVPREMGSEEAYLSLILEDLVPVIAKESLCNRFDIFIEKSAFSVYQSTNYLKKLKALGFQLTIHGDQFTPGGSGVAIDCEASSVDHLEASRDVEIDAMAKSDVIPVALPGASIGLGCDFAPARKLLDKGASLAIASDWNPGSAPQGNLLAQASILSTFEKLSAAEIFSGITYRSARALGLEDRGKMESGKVADIISFPCQDYREILYNMGEMKVSNVWKKGKRI